MPVITKEQFEEMKSYFPDDEKIQSATYEELLANTNNGEVDFNNEEEVKLIVHPKTLQKFDINCGIQCGFVAIDAIFALLGAGGIIQSWKLNEAACRAAAEVIEVQLTKLPIRADFLRIGDATLSTEERLNAAGRFLVKLASAGALAGLLKTFWKHLHWWQAALLISNALFLVMSAFASDGLSLVALIMVEAGTVALLLNDAVKAGEICFFQR
ncbi:hypothetical protein ACFVEL_22215 [Bacillus thuringiensis]|uniref:hypothetical protein n=1 Tax=Bacillus cereus group TaxID=86661 RepID=UPI00234BA389|nr:hypothetical protein [Bacillus cereus]